jgi:hypothetical protein
MLRLVKPWVLVAVVATVAALCTAAPADAAFKLRIGTSAGGPFTTVTDGDGDGAITFSGAVGSFFVTVTAGNSKPLLPNTPSKADMDLTILAVSTGAGSLFVDLTDTDYVLSPSPGQYILRSSMSGNADGTVKFQSWVSFGTGGNGEFQPLPLSAAGGTQVTTGPQGPLTGSPIGDVVIKDFTGSSPFSMTSRTELTATGAGQLFSTDGRTTVVTPAPAGMILAVSAFPFAGAFFWLRRRKAVQPV